MRSIAIILAFAVGASGCAIAVAKGPPDGPVSIRSRPDCNSGKGAVAADGLAGAGLGVAAIALGSADEGSAAAVVGLMAAAFVGSAIAGSRSADRCQDYNQKYDALIAQRLDAADRRAVAAEAAQRLDLDPDGDPVAPVATPRTAPTAPTATGPNEIGPIATGPILPGPTARPAAPTAKPAGPTVKPAAPAVKPAATAPTGGGDDDDASDDDGGDDAGDEDVDVGEPGHWAQFWREVKP